ncbi:MFS transporter [Nocardia sp. NPDC056064]|uniref:MFS transporter n=1 Tax=Nocardia sp. NPDC056064 TaxID=3345701 RepID=UPI0035DEA984
MLRSTVGLLRDRSVAGICLSGAVIGVAFGVFWNTIPFELQATFGFGPAAVGAFGLVAAVSAAASPIAGRLADRYGVRGTQTAVLAALLLGWLLIAAPPPWPVVVVAAIVIDVGLWSNQVVNQAALFHADPRDHSKLNTLYFGSRFAGISAGSAFGTAVWSQLGWHAVVAAGAGCSVVGLAVFRRFVRSGY